ncbi:beta-lactamase family protein [Westerdykella ornata]|uniref:Beta-lactamase family protein n=1 Tax=Westerdykella ornata TaxID=318751 RepID=A0A6A6JVW9_WESOR|nr:beta-lactamase family protein [Westerdykella ornata]KAF2280537.1 beta-lactamase family protein [Westerdykella ornata]
MIITFLRLLPFVLPSVVHAACYEPNVAHPLPQYDSENAATYLEAAINLMESQISALLADPDYVSTSFSIEITSSKRTLWQHHHTAHVRNPSRPSIPVVNGDALYRIASLTKTFTVLGILYQHAAGNLSLDDPIPKYIEELRDAKYSNLPWKDITLRSLASQLSGIPRDCMGRDHGCFELGLPPISRHEVPNLPQCDEYGDNYEPPCTETDLLDALRTMEPTFAPNQKSTYSNIAFELLGLVLARLSNQTYESYIESAIFRPFDMMNSTFSTPPDEAGVIPLDPHYWDVDAGVQNPTGGIYSSSVDLSKYLRYILTHYNGITSALNWAHPASPADGMNSFYGIPWEIFRTDRILEGSRRAVRFITKGGALPGYFSTIMTVPEYDLGITILVAGQSKLVFKLRDLVTTTVVRAAEAIAIRQLQDRYVGRYTPSDSSLNTSFALVADARGLVVTEFMSNSTDVLKVTLPRLIQGEDKDVPWYAQLVPTLLYRDEAAQAGEKWRIVATQERVEGNGNVWDDFCSTDYGVANYAGKPLNEVILWSGDSGVVERIDLPAFKAKLVREKDGGGAESILEQDESMEL